MTSAIILLHFRAVFVIRQLSYMKEETEAQGRLRSGGRGCAHPHLCGPAGPLDLLRDYVTPIETLRPGTQHTNRIRVSGFETGKHQGGEGRRAAQGWGWRRAGGGGAQDQSNERAWGEQPMS